MVQTDEEKKSEQAAAEQQKQLMEMLRKAQVGIRYPVSDAWPAVKQDPQLVRLISKQ